MLRLFALPLSWCLLLLTACGGSTAAPPAPAKPQAATADPKATGTAAPTIAAQEPGKTLLETLLERRRDEPVFLADPDERSEFPAVHALRGPLRERSIPFESPTKWHYQKYQYYLNRLIPMVRWKGRIWLVYDHRHAELAATLEQMFLSKHKVEWKATFAEATLMLVSNEFDDAGRTIDLHTVVSRGGMATGTEFSADGALMLVASKSGSVRWFSRTSQAEGAALKLPTAANGQAGVYSGGEAGLIGLALHPRYPSEPKIYLHYNWQYSDGKRAAIVSEWRVDLAKQPKELAFVDERKLLELPMVADNHNGGCLRFGPDGLLYIAIGDGEDGQWTIGRSPSHSLRGKILRIDVNRRDEGKPYAVPADNPFVGKDGFPPETWAWGFRNPWRFAFLPDGRIVAGDIGEDVNEELTFVVRGKHHGWPFVEGRHQRNKLDRELDLQPALLPYGRESGMSVIAGQVYEGKELPDLRGAYVFCDHLSGYIWAIDLPQDGTALEIADAHVLARWPLLLTSIDKAPDGELYFGAHTGEVLRLQRPTGAANAAAELAPADPAMVRGLFAAEYPAPAAPPATAAQIALGQRLFGEVRWSADGKLACASCHDPARHGQDGNKVAVGTTRNTSSVWNASRQFAQFHDYRAPTVEAAAEASLGAHLGHAAPAAAIARLAALPGYEAEFQAAYPGAAPALSLEHASHALGAFVRQLTTRSRWDDFLDGNDQALTRDELVGLNTFVGSGCMTCHQYRGLGGGMPQKLGLMQPWTGPDRGRFAVDPTPGQEFFFKVPALFDVANTGPYYHDGSMATLADAVRHMASAQLNRQLTPEQVQAIVTFLGALGGARPKILGG
ncbi:MAG: PQQ-dependent sugar dehydrogenase [Planctomycetes bacterium]|nr:PQQ-dependent sugar dehydrogenase [Planctomycetota bacterium]